MMQQIEEQCTMGVHAGIIIPPSWIIKLPRKVGSEIQCAFPSSSVAPIEIKLGLAPNKWPPATNYLSPASYTRDNQRLL